MDANPETGDPIKFASAHDLRRAVYAHLHRLSMSYYDKQQVGPLISTITDDINAVQTFASTSLVSAEPM